MKIKLGILTIFFQSFFCLSQENDNSNKGILFVPIVFHIITENDITTAYKKEVKEMLDLVVSEANDRMNNVDLNLIVNNFDKEVGVPDINLFIPYLDKNCKPVSSISYHKKPIYPTGGHIPIIDDYFLRKYGYLNPSQFLNVWVVDLLDFSFLWNDCSENISVSDINGHNADIFIDGILIDRKLFNISVGGVINTLIHEVGHYLGLKHTWGFNSDCFFDDGIEDTPLQGRSNKDRVIPRKACFNNSIYTNHQNFMDYSLDRRMFTKDQVTAMRNELGFERSELLWRRDCGNNIIVDISGFFVDERDNKKYKWVRVGNKKWMADNLKYNSSNSLCYNNQEFNCDIYGRLYNWEEAINVCPEGWRLPTTEDWEGIHFNFGNNLNSIKSTQGWLNENGANQRQINILPSGYYSIIKRFNGLGSRASFWLADDLGNSPRRNSRTINDGNNQIPLSGTHFSREKLSCRCIQDL